MVRVQLQAADGLICKRYDLVSCDGAVGLSGSQKVNELVLSQSGSVHELLKLRLARRQSRVQRRYFLHRGFGIARFKEETLCTRKCFASLVSQLLLSLLKLSNDFAKVSTVTPQHESASCQFQKAIEIAGRNAVLYRLKQLLGLLSL
jgi:hypothetical protein